MASYSNNESKTLSDLNDDVLLEVFQSLFNEGSTEKTTRQFERHTLKSLSLVNHRFNALASRQLFRRIVVGRPGQGIANGNWGLVHDFVSSIGAYPGVLRLIRSIKFDIYNCGDRRTAKLPLRPLPSLAVIQMINFISSLPNLQELTIYIPCPHNKVVKGVVQSTTHEPPLVFPSIKALVINHNALFMVERCPNLESLRIHDAHWLWRPKTAYEARRESRLGLKDAIEALKAAGKLSRLDAECDWNIEDVRALIDACPQLQHLVMMPGTPYHHSLPSITKQLGAGLPNLQGLAIADDSGAMLDLLPRHDIARSIGVERSDRRERWLDETNDENKAIIAFNNIPSLEVLWVGDRAVATRPTKRDALGKAQWTWERRNNPRGGKSE